MNLFRVYCLCTFIALCSWSSVTLAQIVGIPDKNLRQAVREALTLSDEMPLTQQEMQRLTRLEVPEKQIEDLTGLEYASNLKWLRLQRNNISDVKPLSELNQLEGLGIWTNPISNLSPLINLTNLRFLDLAACHISDLTPLTNLIQLEWLTLEWQGGDRITDIKPLENLTNLRHLRLHGNRIVDVSPLANLTQLTDLTLANNAITDFQPLFGLNLQSVDIDFRKLQELASADVKIHDPNLERAIREELGLPAKTSLTQLAINQLTRLDAPEKQIEDLTGLEYAINLKWLRLQRNNISDLKPLAKLTQLEYLGLWSNPISDLSPIANLTQLRGLNLAGCHISDLTPLSRLVHLQWLTLQWQRDTWITDITPLTNLTTLRDLKLSGNRIVDTSPLANLTMLEILWLDSNRISNLNPLTQLTRLKELHIENNPILDYSPLDGLSLTNITRDEVCKLPGLPLQDRIENRNLPSIFAPWRETMINRPDLSSEDQLSYHDLFWQFPPFGLQFKLTPQGYELGGSIGDALSRRDALLTKNPNMLILAEIRVRDAGIGFHYPEDWFGWLRDDDGNLVPNVELRDTVFLIDFKKPEVQDIIVQRAIAVSQCGLYDGIMIDWWNEGSVTLASPDWSIHYATAEEELEIKTSLLRRIRAQVPDKFLIISNNNRRKLPASAPYMNGSFMETFRDRVNGRREYTREGIIEIEDALIWLEANMREPQINCLEGWGIPTEPPDSSNNRRWMRLFTTMSLTLSDGYVLYNVGWDRTQSSFPGHYHHWYPFWDANLGQPIEQTARRYQNIEGLYIREFTNGWAAYNRSGQTQTITLPSSATPVSDRGSTAASLTHLLPDLDGEIYIATRSFADVNGDGVVNILDLVMVANGFGKSAPDPNGDGVVNILDLVFVAQQFSQ